MKRLSFTYSCLAFLGLYCGQPGGTGDKTGPTGYYAIDDFDRVEKIDAHVHLWKPLDTNFIKQAEADNFYLHSLHIYKTGGQPIEDQQEFSLELSRKYPGRVCWSTTFSLKDYHEKDWQKKAVDYLESSLKRGAVAVKVWKNIGMELRDSDSSLVMIDNPRFDPLLDYLEKKKIPLIAHLGEPRNCWLPIEQMTVKGDRNYFSKHPEHHLYLHPEFPGHEEYLAARNRMLDKRPGLIFIGAHLGSMEWSIDQIAEHLDKYPNMAVDMAERISHFQAQAVSDHRKVYDFFIRYQDRLLYGSDLRLVSLDIDGVEKIDPGAIKVFAHSVWRDHWRFFVSDETMETSEVNGAFKGLKLPKETVDKIYRGNAQKWLGIKRQGSPGQ
ncbi:MAG: amidohydrolase family protein [Chitinophagaceae bacterium]|nr:amidohydrolase family protein [Chitinophagaceae bacterium]